MPRTIKNISEYIYEKRLAMGLNQRQFAGFLELGENGERTVGRWERGENIPSPAKLKLIRDCPDRIPFKSPFHDKKTKPAFRFIDLFAGIGGIRLPFQETGGHCVFSSEWDKFSKKTYAANYGEIPEGDITRIPADKIPPHDLLLAGFPCQAFSQAGLRKGFYDTRGTMFFEIQRILAHHRPKALLLENVRQLRSHDKGRTLATILAILKGEAVPDIPPDILISQEARHSLRTRLNYNVDCSVLCARNFGVPQNRNRIYIIGFDRDQVPSAMQRNLAGEIFKELGNCSSDTCLGNILGKNRNIDPKYTISDRLYEGHKRRLAEYKVKGNGFGFSLFNHESPYCNTISARYFKDGSEVLIDQSDIGRNPRKLTPRECARAQGFPEEFNIDVVSDVQNYRQFGNSVSVPVIRAIAEKMVPYLGNR